MARHANPVKFFSMRNCVQWIEISFIDCVTICGDGEFLDNGLACRAEIDENSAVLRNPLG